MKKKKKKRAVTSIFRAMLKNPHPYHPNVFRAQGARSPSGDPEAAEERGVIPVGSSRAASLAKGRKEDFSQSQAPEGSCTAPQVQDSKGSNVCEGNGEHM